MSPKRSDRKYESTKKWFSHLSFRFMPLILACTMIVNVISLSVISLNAYYSTQRYIINNTENLSMRIAKQINSKLNDCLEYAKSIDEFLASDSELINNIEEYEKLDPVMKHIVPNHIVQQLVRMQNLNGLVELIIVWTENHIYFSDQTAAMRFSALKSSSIDRQFISVIFSGAMQGHAVFHNGKDKNFKDSNKSILSGNSFFICDTLDEAGNPIHIIVLLDTHKIGELFNNSDSITLLDEDNNLIWSNSNTDITEFNGQIKNYPGWITKDSVDITQTNNNVIYRTTLKINNWQLCLFQNNDVLKNQIMTIRKYFLMYFLLIIVLHAIAAGIIGVLLSRPINRLLYLISQYSIESNDDSSFRKLAKRRRVSIRRSAMVFFSLGVFLSAVVYMFFIYGYSSKIIHDYMIEKNVNAFREVNSNLEQLIQKKIDAGMLISFNSEIQLDYIAKMPENLRPRKIEVSDVLARAYDYQKSIGEVAGHTLNLAQSLDDIALFDIRHECMFSSNSFLSKDKIINDILDVPVNDTTALYWMRPMVQNLRETKCRFYINVRELYTLKRIGFLYCQFNESEIGNVYQSLENDYSEIYVVDNDGTIISTKNTGLIGTDINNVANLHSIDDIKINDVAYHDDSFTISQNIKGTPWKIIGVYSNKIFNQDRVDFINSNVYILLIILLIAVFTALMVSYLITKPFSSMSMIIESSDFMRMNIFSDASRINEVNKLGNAFNEMISRNKALLNELLDTAVREKDAQMNALQAQINPHFLYNTYNSINLLIECDQKEQAVIMIKALSNMMRYSCDMNNSVVPISGELEYVSKYVDIMKIRYNDSIEINFDIEPIVIQFKIPKLSLQPLVENSITHGLAPKQGIGRIDITCKLEGDMVHIVIKDNGIGMEPDKLAAVQESLENFSKPGGRIGLHNIYHRMKLFYGDRFQFCMESVYGIETSIHIRFPRV